MNQIVKIFFFLLMATMLASITVYGSSSDVSMQKRIEFNSRKSINSEKIRVNAKSIENKTQMRVITNQPEGESKRYNVTGEGVILDGAHLTTGAFSGRADIVYGADNKVYIKNIIAGLGNYFGDSWVEGTIEGNEIHVPMGQSIYWSNDYQADVVLCMGTTRIVDNTITFQADDQATEAIFVIDGSTITLQGGYADPVSVEYPEYEGYGLGTFWTDDASFGGFIEWNTTLEEVIKVTTYTVAGTPVSIFGTEWDPANTENDMVNLGNGYYKLTKNGYDLVEGTEVQFRIVGNHSWDFCWPVEQVVIPISQDGRYDITFYYDSEDRLVQYQIWGEFFATSISLDNTIAEMTEGNTMQLTATILPSNTTNKTVIWTTSNSSIATVDDNGLVTAIAPGSVTITASTADGTNLNATCNITVKQNIVLATSVFLNYSSLEINEGDIMELKATVLPSNTTNKAVLWSSSDNNVATVDNDGMVTALDDGSAIITATTTDGSNLSASCNVTVVRPVTGLTLNESSLELVLPETAQLIATITPSNPTNGTLRWTSSKSSVATVDDNGLVTSVTPGTATITATTTDGTNLSASCSVTVRRQYVTSITLNETSLEMHLGDTFQLSAEVAPANASNKTLNWSSSKTSVASVDANGLVTAKSVGSAIITARAADGSNVSTSCIVNVLPDYYISLDTLTHIRGEAANLVDLPVSLFNKNPISAIQFDVSLPTCVSFGYPEMWLDEDRATRSHSLSINQLSSNSYRVLIASSTAKNLKGNDGPITHMNILMSKTISTTGNYYINISNIIASESDETQHILNNSKGVVRYYYIVGDADADASVDIADYMATASKILGRSPSPFYSDAADVDANSSINVTDLVGIANISLGIKPITLRYSPRQGSELDCLTCEPLAIVGGGEGEATLNLDAGYDFAAFQMDLSLPQGMTLKDAVLGNEASKLQLTWTTLPDGKVRLLASSFSDAEVMGACPGLLTLKVKTDESFVGSSIGISVITFAERNLNSHKFDDMEVEYYGTTAVQEIDGASRIYVEGGMIIVDTPMNGKVVLSDVSGHTREYSVTIGRNEIAPWTTGILMIKFNNQTLKINLK